MSGHRSPKRHEFTWNPIWGNTGRDPFNQHSNRSDREKWSTSKGGPVFPKLFWLDQTDPLSFGPKFPEILVEWIARSCKQYHHRYQYQSDSVTSLYQLGCHWGKWLQKTLITPWTCNSQVHESAKQIPTFDLLACESIRFFRFRRWPEIRLRVCRLSTCMTFLAFDKHMMQMCCTYFHGDSLYGKINRFWLHWNLY